MQEFPITSLFPKLRQQLNTHKQILIQAPTGSGKSTVLPTELLNWSEIQGKILMLEPRRIATRSIAHYIAQNRQQKVGEEVGFRIRGETKVSEKTRLEVVTEGILTRIIQHDPELSDVSVIIFDEVHERNLATDLGLALTLEVQQGLREDLIIILMSATLQHESVSHILPDAVLLASQGRSYPVSIEYQPPTAHGHYLETISSVIFRWANDQNTSGHMLVFLPGKAEILRLKETLSYRLPPIFSCLPLYSALGHDEQNQAMQPISNKRKVILATNVAESSVTIDGINTVIDSGLKKQANYNPRTGITRLTIQTISQASATQRAGRAGRQSQGHCIRIWRKEDNERRSPFDAPDITQSNVLDLAFNCAVWGAKNINDLPLLTPST